MPGPELPLKGIAKKRGNNYGFLQFESPGQMNRFQELYAADFLPNNTKMKLKEVTKKINIREFKTVRSEEEQRADDEKRKENKVATPEEIAEEMKVPLADRVTPYHRLTYEEQIEKKKEQLILNYLQEVAL